MGRRGGIAGADFRRISAQIPLDRGHNRDRGIRIYNIERFRANSEFLQAAGPPPRVLRLRISGAFRIFFLSRRIPHRTDYREFFAVHRA